MFALYCQKRITKRWRKLGEYSTLSEAYETLNAVVSGYPAKLRQTYRITETYQNLLNYNLAL